MNEMLVECEIASFNFLSFIVEMDLVNTEPLESFSKGVRSTDDSAILVSHVESAGRATLTLVFPNTVFVVVEEEVPDVADKDTFILFELSMLLLLFEIGKGVLVDVDGSAKSVVAVVVVNMDIGCEVEGNWLLISLVVGLVSFIELAPPNTLAVSSNIFDDALRLGLDGAGG